MSALSMVEARLPPGFRFHPRDDELVCDYLQKKMNRRGQMMIDVDLNKCEPWDLPDISCLNGKEWYFFNLRDRKYATGQRTNRATQSGYWKATGKDRSVMRKGVLVGMRKTLVFYEGRAPKGKKTDWVMHEFRIEDSLTGPPKIPIKEDWVLCRVFFKSRNLAPTRILATATTVFSPFHSFDGSSAPLPRLLDATYTTTDDRTHGNLHHIQTNLHEFHQDLQVPCFSNSLPGPTAATDRQPAPPPHPPCHLAFNANCESNMMKAVMSHLTKLGERQKMEASMSLEDGVVESYLSTEAGLHNLW